LRAFPKLRNPLSDELKNEEVYEREDDEFSLVEGELV
jgi:hypothetical protein